MYVQWICKIHLDNNIDIDNSNLNNSNLKKARPKLLSVCIVCFHLCDVTGKEILENLLSRKRSFITTGLIRSRLNLSRLWILFPKGKVFDAPRDRELSCLQIPCTNLNLVASDLLVVPSNRTARKVLWEKFRMSLGRDGRDILHEARYWRSPWRVLFAATAVNGLKPR